MKLHEAWELAKDGQFVIGCGILLKKTKEIPLVSIFLHEALVAEWVVIEDEAQISILTKKNRYGDAK
jgi:hypothetical protein